LQKDAVEKVEGEILSFVSDKLQNNKIKLTIEIVELEEKKQLYTDSDKYKYLTEKNANLNKLKQQFNLDF
jgi:DNA polymerase-3 subunit gamma/tau